MGLITDVKTSISRATSSLFSAQDPRRIGIYGPPNAGKCLAADEPVMLADGTYSTIETVFESVRESCPNATDVSEDPGEQWLECTDTDVRVPALTNDLDVLPAEVTHVYRQRYDGRMFRVRTELGREVTVSPAHPFVALTEGGVEHVRATDATEGLSIALLSEYSPDSTRFSGESATVASDGGRVVAGPALDEPPMGSDVSSGKPGDGTVPEDVFTAADETVSAYLRARFHRRGCIRGENRSNRPGSIVLTAPSREAIVGTQILLVRFGIVGEIRPSPGNGTPEYELAITDSDGQRAFRDHVGFGTVENAERLDALCGSGSNPADTGPVGSCTGGPTQSVPAHEDADVRWDEIVAIDEVEYDGYIYDLTVEDHHTFATADGLVVHNTTLANRIARDWTGDAVGPESHVPHETRRARRKENIDIERNGKSVSIDIVDTPGVATKVDYTEFLDHDIDKEDAIRRSREATEGVAEAMHWLREDVDGVIYVLDSTEDPFTQVNTMLIGIIESQNLPVLILANKTDLEESAVQRIKNAFPQHETIPLSALEGDNMDEVYDKVAEYFG